MAEIFHEAESMQAEIDSLIFNSKQLHNRLRKVEKYLDTLQSPLWKRLLFRIDGWGPWYYNRQKPKWRPWRRWWTS